MSHPSFPLLSSHHSKLASSGVHHQHAGPCQPRMSHPSPKTSLKPSPNPSRVSFLAPRITLGKLSDMSVTKEEAELAYHDNTNESATQENTLPTPQVDSGQSLITGGTANHYSSSGALPPGTSPCQLRPSGSAPASFDPSHDTSHSSSGSLPPGTSPCQLRPSHC